MEMTLNEAKHIAQQLQILVLKLNGTKNEDGTINTPGVLTELNELVNKLDSTNVNFFNKIQRDAAEKSLKQIEKLLHNQISLVEDMNDKLLADNKNFADTWTKSIHQVAQDSIGEWLKPSYDDLQTKYSAIQALLVKFETEVAKITNNYMFLVFATLIGLAIGILIGLSI